MTTVSPDSSRARNIKTCAQRVCLKCLEIDQALADASAIFRTLASSPITSSPSQSLTSSIRCCSGTTSSLDLSIKLLLTERVGVAEADGKTTIPHFDEPALPDLGGPLISAFLAGGEAL